MMVIKGSGGEGKSQIGHVLSRMFGPNAKDGSVGKISENPFARADLEHIHLMIDDDMRLEALKQTNYIKAIVTAKGKMDLARKGKQSYQGFMYARILAFSNGDLVSLYDRSDGFFRRQLILTTKRKPPDRIDDPNLSEKLCEDMEGIFLWAMAGLLRLVKNNFQFTESSRAKLNREMVKKAAITANMRLGLVPEDKAKAVMQACDEVISGKWNSEFIVDMIQGGAGTSTNMNTNEVITNRALEIMGHKRGDYEFISPNDIVNKCQSTNDTYPSSAKLGMYLDHFAMVEQMQLLGNSFAKKAEEFKDVMKMGRTQLQDGVPMTLGQEFHAYASTLQEDVDLVKEAAKVFLTVNLGGTAIGTGTAAHPDYSANAVKALREITGFDIKIAPDLINASSNTSGMLYFSSVLRRCATKLSQVCNDLRLLASGPRCGLHEINLPPLAPGAHPP